MPSRVRALSMVFVVLSASMLVCAGSTGSFRGTVVDGPSGSGGRWILVQGRNGMSRRVEISHARVVYDEALPADQRHGSPEDALVLGVEVRISAEQGADGEWKATRIEILGTATAARPPGKAS